jgi:peptide chain release factor 3
MNNFGVELFLQSFLGYAETPRAMPSDDETVQPTDDEFSGFVFKLQVCQLHELGCCHLQQ